MREASTSNVRKEELAGPGDRWYIGGFFCHVKVRDAASLSRVEWFRGWPSWSLGMSAGLWCPWLGRSRSVSTRRGWQEPPLGWPQGWQAHPTPGPGPASIAEPTVLSTCKQWISHTVLKASPLESSRDTPCTQIDSDHHLGRFGWQVPHLCHYTARRLIFNLPFLFSVLDVLILNSEHSSQVDSELQIWW